MPMPIGIRKTELEGVLEIATGVARDERGFFSEAYSSGVWRDAGFDEEFQAAQKEDPTLTPAIYAIQQAQSSGGGGGMGMYPAFFRWYYHAGYKDAWQRREWHDPSMKREFDEYFQEALEKGWWEGLDYPRPEHEPRVHIESGGNALRRMRGGSKMLLEHLWPKLTMAVTFDLRMSATALYSDIVLPVAHHYEKIRFGIPGTHVMNMTFCDKAVEPPDEAPDELEGFRRLAEALELNESLFTAYYLKDDLREVWEQDDQDAAQTFLLDWIARAEASGIRMLMGFAKTLRIHALGILAWYDHEISTGPLEGTNNKIKTLKRQAYGFRDLEFFKLKIYALHKTGYAFLLWRILRGVSRLGRITVGCSVSSLREDA